MSHELRTPLNAIIGFSEVLSDGLIGEHDRQAARLHRRHLQQRQASALADQRHPRPVEGRSRQDDARPRAGAGGVAVRQQPVDHPGEGGGPSHPPRAWTSAEDLGSIQADARKVKQIVYNLLSNAVKFTGEGGQVTLRASRVPRAEVGQLSGAWPGRSFPLADSDVRRVSRDQRHRQRHRHLAGGPGAAVQAVQPDRQRPGAKVRRHRARAGDGQAARRAARRRGGGGERRRARARASRSGCRSGRRTTARSRSRRAPAVATRRGAAGRAHRAGRGRRSQVGRADPRAARGRGLHGAARRLRRGRAGARRAAAAVADHARHHAAQHGRLGVSRPPQADAGRCGASRS